MASRCCAARRYGSRTQGNATRQRRTMRGPRNQRAPDGAPRGERIEGGFGSVAEYDPQAIEAKWQKSWEAQGAFHADVDPARPEYYVLEMLPYPSGTLHMGHMRNYTIG